MFSFPSRRRELRVFPPHQKGERGPTGGSDRDRCARHGGPWMKTELPLETNLHLDLTPLGRRLGRRRLRRRGQHPLANIRGEGGRGWGRVGGDLPSGRITATTARLQSSLSLSLSGARPRSANQTRNVQGPPSRSIDIETSRITHTRA